MSTELKPVGFYCDHSDEPINARTHHDWEWVEGEGHVFQHSPNTISSHGGTRDCLTPEQQEQRCPRAVPVYAGPDVDRLRAETLTEAADEIDALRNKQDVNVATYQRYDFRQRIALGDAESKLRRMASDVLREKAAV